MKKYLLPLILILFLTFTLVGNCAWLSGYDQRIKLTIDNTKIDSALSDFPVTVFFTSTQGEEIFTEFDADSDYVKCAFTTSDGTTQLYAERELFDDSAQKAIYHVKVPSVASGADTDIYYYYDNDHADNTTYIGGITTTAGRAVWDGNFVSVYHMLSAVEALLESTSNNYTGTKRTEADPSATASGKIDGAQDFDGANDYILLPKLVTNPTEITIEGIFKADNTSAEYRPITHNNLEPYTSFKINQGGTANRIYVYMHDGVASSVQTDAYTVTNYNYIAATGKENDFLKLYVNAAYIGSDAIGNFVGLGVYQYNYIGCDREGLMNFPGIIDEVRFSNVVRSAAWLKGTYNSLWDILFTYGSEEEAEAEEDNAIFFGTNF